MMRSITIEEENLIRYLGRLGEVKTVDEMLNCKDLRIQNLDDGGMGSFEIFSSKKYAGEKKGRVAATAVSEDRDGVMLIATLFVNENGFPYEVDIWKVDFSPLIELPEIWHVENFPRFPGTGTG